MSTRDIPCTEPPRTLSYVGSKYFLSFGKVSKNYSTHLQIRFLYLIKYFYEPEKTKFDLARFLI